MASETEPTGTRLTSPRQAALGIFIIFQLVFLVWTNMSGFSVWLAGEATDTPKKLMNQAIPDVTSEHSQIRSWVDQIETCTRRYTQLTLQDQDWSLFAPSVGKSTGFPFIVLAWDEPTSDVPFLRGTMAAYSEKNGYHVCAPWNPPGQQPTLAVMAQLGVLNATNPVEVISLQAITEHLKDDVPTRVEVVRSENEPADIHGFIRYSNCRIRRFEGQLYLNLQPYEDESKTTTGERTSRRVRNLCRDYHDFVLAYMRWRLRAWQAAHPDKPAPKQVILFQRSYRIHGPDEPERGWVGPILYPFARTRVSASGDNVYGLEAFDFSDQRFYSTSK